MTDKTDPIAHAARLLREAAEELQQGHTLSGDRNNWTGEPEAKAAYDEHMGAAAALEAIAASAGSEPVAHLWQHGETGRTRVLMPDMIVDADASWRLVGPLFLGSPPSPPEGMVGRWMPIETAPKDGTLIVLGARNGVWLGKYAPFYQSGYRPENPWSSMLLNHDHMAERYTRPTHWMPLPPPPTTPAGNEKGE